MNTFGPKLRQFITWLVLIAGVAVFANLLWGATQAVQQADPATDNSPYPPPGTPPMPAPTFPPLPTATPTPTATPFPPIAWGSPPSCVNQPQDAASWKQAVNTSKGNDEEKRMNAHLRQAKPMTAALAGATLDDVVAILNTPDNARGVDILRRELTVLWFNVLSGRLNRATEVDFPALPEIRTVGDLADAMERALVQGDAPGALIGISKQFQSGKGTIRPVCARLFDLQLGNQLREIAWSDAGFVDQPLVWQPDTADFNWIMGRLVPSPDYRWIAIETFAYESGGPVYLFDVERKTMANLNRQIGLTLGGAWEIVGWHPDSKHLLLGSEGQPSAFWIDLNSNTYKQIPLSLDGTANAGRAYLGLAQDGNKFIYVKSTGSGNSQQLNLYDLLSDETTTLFTLTEGGLYFPRFSPSGSVIAHTLEKGHPLTGLTYAIQLFDITTNSSVTLVEGDLSQTEPVWSPDGQMIAFEWKDPALPNGFWSPVSEGWLGNIWVASVQSGEAWQVTFIQGAARRPVWSTEGRFLSFFTHDGQLGLADLTQPGVMWQVATPLSDWPLLTSTIFLP